MEYIYNIVRVVHPHKGRIVSRFNLDKENFIRTLSLCLFAEIIQAKHDKLDFVKNNINTIINFINEKLSDNEFINDEV